MGRLGVAKRVNLFVVALALALPVSASAGGLPEVFDAIRSAISRPSSDLSLREREMAVAALDVLSRHPEWKILSESEVENRMNSHLFAASGRKRAFSALPSGALKDVIQATGALTWGSPAKSPHRPAAMLMADLASELAEANAAQAASLTVQQMREAAVCDHPPAGSVEMYCFFQRQLHEYSLALAPDGAEGALNPQGRVVKVLAQEFRVRQRMAASMSPRGFLGAHWMLPSIDSRRSDSVSREIGALYFERFATEEDKAALGGFVNELAALHQSAAEKPAKKKR